MHIFISREQTPDSVFFQTLTANSHIVHGESLIEFTPVPFDEVPDTDWVFFYSKNGVRYFFEQLKAEMPPGKKFAAIGPGTADYLEERFRHPHFVGNGNAETTAEAFLKMANGQKVLFPRAMDSRRSIQQILEGKAVLVDLIVYDNVPRKTIELPEFDILVFTSPLNAKAYFSQKKIKEHQPVIAIGKTTATSLKKLGVKNIIVPDFPSEEALAQTILAL